MAQQIRDGNTRELGSMADKWRPLNVDKSFDYDALS